MSALQRSTHQPPAKVEDLAPDAYLRDVWHAFADIFGKAWYTNRGSSASGAWAEAIQKLERSKVFVAVRSYAKPEERPPNLPDFLSRYRALFPPVVTSTEEPRDVAIAKFNAQMERFGRPELKFVGTKGE